MGILFAKKGISRITDKDKSLLQLKQTRDKIKQYQKRVQLSIERDRKLAKKLMENGQKERALLLLRKKKFQERVLTKTENQMEIIETMVTDLEFSDIEMRVIDGLKIGNEALKKLQDILSIDEINEIMENTNDAVEKQNELAELLMGTLTHLDEHEVEAELDALLVDAAEASKLSGNIILPDVPKERVGEKDPVRLAEKEETRTPVVLET